MRAFCFVFFILLVSLAEAQSVVKQVLRLDEPAPNLLQPDRFRPYGDGFEQRDGLFLCDNAGSVKSACGVSQGVTLDQKTPIPIYAEAWSKAEDVSGSPDSDYSVYLDIAYADGTFLWGQTAPFSTGTHDWEKRSVFVIPEKPVKSLSFYTLFRNKSGKVSFRDLKLTVARLESGAALFHGVPIVLPKDSRSSRITDNPQPIRLQLRDVAADSDFYALEDSTLEIRARVRISPLATQHSEPGQTPTAGNYCTVTLANQSGRDRCLTLVFAVDPGPRETLRICMPRKNASLSPHGTAEHVGPVSTYPIGSSGRLSRYPIFAVENAAADAGALSGGAGGLYLRQRGFFCRVNTQATGELFVAVDLALTTEMPEATLGFYEYTFDGGFRGAWDRYQRLDGFQSKETKLAASLEKQGVWMPFHPISKVPDHEDFGFRFKEGVDEPGWDDDHDILTFRYTEPMTWWMSLPEDLPRTYEAALDHARKLAEEGNDHAKALFVGGMKDADGRFSHRLLDTPWCDGVVWSLCDLPNIPGGDFEQKWSKAVRERYYGEEIRKKYHIDGEYIDSSEGYVTALLNFNRDHFAAVRTPLVFSRDDRNPAVFRGLVAYEYVRAIAEDVHNDNRLVMANATPGSLCWLAPFLDVMGTETDWHHGGQWRPMPGDEMLYRRFLCGRKPYCFLMNTDFSQWTFEMTEKFMKRSLAFGMFPGFFSEDASTGHYFSRPELYDRDRPLFKRYIPLCREIAEAGWQPVTFAQCDNDNIFVERFGGQNGKDRIYWTILNDSPDPQTVAIRFLIPGTAAEFTDRLSNRVFKTDASGATTVTIEPEDILVLEMKP